MTELDKWFIKFLACTIVCSLLGGIIVGKLISLG